MYYAAEGNPVTWERFYADAACQLYPVIFGLNAPTDFRSVTLFNRFKTAHGAAWQNLTADAFPWTILSYAYAKMKDYASVDQYLQNCKTTYIDTGNLYPWHCGEAGFILRTAAYMKSLN